LAKSTTIPSVLIYTNFSDLFKNKIIYNFMIFVATKNGREIKISSSFGAVVGSGIRDG
jgi:hypothetical protein